MARKVGRCNSLGRRGAHCLSMLLDEAIEWTISKEFLH
jgi:hypothetical protein